VDIRDLKVLSDPFGGVDKCIDSSDPTDNLEHRPSFLSPFRGTPSQDKQIPFYGVYKSVVWI
jgi:hypothetical protein